MGADKWKHVCMFAHGREQEMETKGMIEWMDKARMSLPLTNINTEA